MRQRISKKKKELYGDVEENKFEITKYRYVFMLLLGKYFL